MFERYTEQARRVVFFARYEASQFGYNQIEDSHLLLGLLREDNGLIYRLLSRGNQPATQRTIDELRRKIEEQIGPPRQGVSTSVDMPLSTCSKRILAYAAEEADRDNQRHIGSEHLMLGILRESKCLAASILNNEAIDLVAARQVVAGSSTFAAVAARDRETMSADGNAPVAGLDFVCDGERIAASFLDVAAPVIPRAGERVTIGNKEGKDLSYRVEDVNYVYEPFPPDVADAPHQLARVIVRVKGPLAS